MRKGLLQEKQNRGPGTLVLREKAASLLLPLKDLVVAQRQPLDMPGHHFWRPH